MSNLINCVSDNSLDIDTLFIQPFVECATNCSGCYLKSFTFKTHADPVDEFIVKVFMNKSSIKTKQLTLSLNVVDSKFMFQHQRRIIQLLSSLYYQVNMGINPAPPELHITIQQPAVWDCYFTNPSAIATLLDRLKAHVSYSQFSSGYLTRFSTEKVYLNWLCPDNITPRILQSDIDYLNSKGAKVDLIYLITKKTNVKDSYYTPEEKLVNMNRLKQDMMYIKTIINNVSDDVRKKIHLDTCLQDVDKFSKTGYGCSANISKFHVWPDGTVSGCPYANFSHGSPANSSQDIIDNIKTARKRYDFTKCHLGESISILNSEHIKSS